MNGGAAKAAYRLLEALNLQDDVYAEMWVIDKKTNNCNVGQLVGRKYVISTWVSKLIEKVARLALGAGHNGYGTLGLVGVPIVKRINSSDFDIVNLHWVHGGMLSISEISRIKKEIVWTLHDMWAFSGFFHYTKRNYDKGNKAWLDIDRRLWKIKVHSWSGKDYKVICPSAWMEAEARKSRVYRTSSIRRIGYAIDTEFWKRNHSSRKAQLGGEENEMREVRILYGAQGGLRDPRKGFDLLTKALSVINQGIDRPLKICLLIAGQDGGAQRVEGIEARYLGRIQSESDMVEVLSMADFAVIPSRSDNLPNMAIEAQSCMLPVVGFRIGGMPDIIEHKITGYLAKEEDHLDLAEGIRFTYNMVRAGSNMGRDARLRVIERFSYAKIGKETVDYFRE